MKNIRVTVQYDGARYRGWQRQKNSDQTIQGKIEQVLEKMCGKPVEVFGAGRTDAGVHARAQIINFHIDTEWDAQEILFYMNKYLPEDIRIVNAKEASQRFHSRLNAIGKTYVYTLIKSDGVDVFKRKYAWQMEETLDVSLMKEAAQVFEGTHDFAAFCRKPSKKKSTIRSISSIRITEDADVLQISYQGNGFLYNMVRILTGAIVMAGQGKITSQQIQKLLEEGVRMQEIETAPAQGLMLWEVEYD